MPVKSVRSCPRELHHFGWWRPSIFAIAVLLLFPKITVAVDKTWNGSQNTLWGNNNNWAGNAPSAGDNAVFNSTFSNQPNVSTNASVGGIWMTGSIGQNVTISGTGTLQLSGNTINGTAGLGILVDNANAFALTISAPIKLGGASEAWTNNSGNILTLSGAVDIATKILTINGSGNTTSSGIISNGTLIKSGIGTLTLSGVNTYSGGTTINGGTVVVNSASSFGATSGGVTVNAGTVEVATGFSTFADLHIGQFLEHVPDRSFPDLHGHERDSGNWKP